jgi:hypothetical protein
MSTTRKQIESEQTNLRNVRLWEQNRQRRADGYASVLHHLNAARAAVPSGDESAARIEAELASEATLARGTLRRVLGETNPWL